jgi:chloride channel 3/4/5
MNFQALSTSLSTAPSAVRRPSLSSRLSSAVSIAERGEAQDGGIIAAQDQIEEEIAKIKRYEVGITHFSRLCHQAWATDPPRLS